MPHQLFSPPTSDQRRTERKDGAGAASRAPYHQSKGVALRLCIKLRSSRTAVISLLPTSSSPSPSYTHPVLGCLLQKGKRRGIQRDHECARGQQLASALGHEPLLCSRMEEGGEGQRESTTTPGKRTAEGLDCGGAWVPHSRPRGYSVSCFFCA